MTILRRTRNLSEALISLTLLPLDLKRCSYPGDKRLKRVIITHDDGDYAPHDPRYWN